jgi:DNA-binding NarL/FixJ family response regulator
MEEKLDLLLKKIDILLIVELTKSGLNKKQVAKVLKISDKTIDKILPYSELKKNLKLNSNDNARQNTEK